MPGVAPGYVNAQPDKVSKCPVVAQGGKGTAGID